MPGPADHGDLLLPLASAAVAGYLLGSLPFGYLVARSRGVDIFQVGSRSPGATNVRRAGTVYTCDIAQRQDVWVCEKEAANT